MIGGIPGFFLLSIGQLISLIGFNLISFVISLWLLEKTGSVTLQAMVPFAVMLAILLISFLAGVFVDRYDRRRVMLASDIGAGVTTIVLAILLTLDSSSPPLLYLVVGTVAAFRGIQWCAHPAVTSMLVPREKLGKAAGFLRLCDALSRFIVPALGAALLTISIRLAIYLSVASFALSIICTYYTRVPANEPIARKGSIAGEMRFAWQYVRQRSGLLHLLLFIGILDFYEAAFLVLYPSLILRIGSSAEVGTILSIGGLGMVAGSLLMSFWGGARGYVRGFIPFTLVQAGSLIAAAFPIGLAGLSVAAFGFFFCAAVLYASGQAIIQTAVPAREQGRLFGISYLITLPNALLGYLVTGLLADHVFCGTRWGIGAILFLVGCFSAGLTLLVFLHPHSPLHRSLKEEYL